MSKKSKQQKPKEIAVDPKALYEPICMDCGASHHFDFESPSDGITSTKP